MTSPVDTAIHALGSALPGIALQVRQNRRTLLSLRGNPGDLRLSIHPLVLSDADHAGSIIDWVRRRGRGGAGVRLRAVLARTHERIATLQGPARWDDVAAMPIAAAAVDAEGILTRMLESDFPGLPRPTIIWARLTTGRLTSIRFGAYRRQPRPGIVSLNPRLDRPWIAMAFIRHVVHHELCHHRQACQPLLRRETAHSARFRTWERAFPEYSQARAWERAALPWLLDDRPPLWYCPA